MWRVECDWGFVAGQPSWITQAWRFEGLTHVLLLWPPGGGGTPPRTVVNTRLGVSLTAFADLFVDLGAQVAYNLDGGGSTDMVFNDALVNKPLGTGKERGTSDILYVAR